LKYTIIHVNDRAKTNMAKIKNILSSFQYVDDIKFCDGNKDGPWHIINNKGISQDAWSPYDGRTFPPLPGELGVWVSNINIFEYIVKNKIDQMLVLEDDAIIVDSFVDFFNTYTKDLPSDFDFFALSYFPDQNNFTTETDIGSKNIHKSKNQYSNGVAMLYSLQGAKKILKLLQRTGLEYTSDCYIFYNAQKNMLNGYSLIKTDKPLVMHIESKIKSLIDPDNIRQTNNNLVQSVF